MLDTRAFLAGQRSPEERAGFARHPSPHHWWFCWPEMRALEVFESQGEAGC